MKKMKKGKYNANYLGDEVTVETDFLDLDNLIRELNDLGFRLGSGHDGIRFDLDKMALILNPYIGKMDQYIYFEPVK